MLALGPDIARDQVIAPTGITQSGRTSGRYETIDAIMTSMTLLGHGDKLAEDITATSRRPGLMMDEVML